MVIPKSCAAYHCYCFKFWVKLPSHSFYIQHEIREVAAADQKLFSLKTTLTAQAMHETSFQTCSLKIKKLKEKKHSETAR